MRNMFRFMLSTMISSIIAGCCFGQSDFDKQLTIISSKLNAKLSKSDNKKVMVMNFTDLQGNVNELGRYFAEALSVELTNTDLEVIDRSGKEYLITELILQKENSVLTDSVRAAIKMAGVNYLIMGSITLLDASIDVTVKTLDMYKGTLVTGLRSQLPRTDAINNLLKNTIRNGGNEPANLNLARKINTDKRSALDDLFEASISELRSNECIHKNYDKTYYLGQICFENQTGEDMIFMCMEPGLTGWLSDYQVGLPNEARNCSPLIPVNMGSSGGITENDSKPAAFTFYSADKKRRVRVIYTIDKCTVKSIVLTKKNMVLMND